MIKKIVFLFVIMSSICCMACTNRESSGLDRTIEDFSKSFQEEISYEIVSVEQGKENVALVELSYPNLKEIYIETKGNDNMDFNELLKKMKGRLAANTLKKSIEIEVIENEGEWVILSDSLICKEINQMLNEFIITVFHDEEWENVDITIFEEK